MGLIVFSLSAHGESGTLKLPIVEGEMPSVLVRSLVTVALLYYAVGFFFEFMASWREHSEAIGPKSAAGFEARMDQIVGALVEVHNKLESTRMRFHVPLEAALSAANWQTTKRQLTEAEEIAHDLKRFEREKPDLAQSADINTRREERQKVIDTVLARREEWRLKDHQSERDRISVIVSSLSNSASVADQLADANAKALLEVKRLRKNMVGLHRQVPMERRIAFFGWEAGGILVATVFALAVGWTPLGDWMASDFPNLLNPVAEDIAETPFEGPEPR